MQEVKNKDVKMQRYGPDSYYVLVPKRWKNRVESKRGAIMGFLVDISSELELKYIPVFVKGILSEPSQPVKQVEPKEPEKTTISPSSVSVDSSEVSSNVVVVAAKPVEQEKPRPHYVFNV